MSAAVLPWVVDALIVLGVATMTIAVYGLIWVPNLYVRLHAASKAMPLGVIPILIAVAVTASLQSIGQLLLIGAFLVITTPVSAHALARVIYLKMSAADVGHEQQQHVLSER